MASSGPTLRAYNALNGREVIEILLTELRRQLEADTRFSQHQTFPLVAWEWKCAINQYPNEPAKFEVHVGPRNITAAGVNVEEVVTDPSLAEVQIDFGDHREVTAPAGETADHARRDAKLPVPTPRTVKGPGGNRMVVDAPEIKPTEQPQATVTPAEQTTNVNKGGKVFARSVTARTAANPEGVVVDAPHGSAPDAARVEQIIEKEADKE
jgi:hypothetical protein